MKPSTPDHQATASVAKQQTSLLREKILAEAKAAGKAGIHVNDLAAKVHLDSRYLRTWLPRIPALRKVGKGLYRFIELPLNSTPYPLGSYRQFWTLAKRNLNLHTAELMEEDKVQTAKNLAEAKAQQARLKARILVELKAAGTKGVRVKELAKTLGLSNSRLGTWLANNGKRCPEIERLCRGTYRLRLTPCKGCGELTAELLAGLQAAGPAGIKVRELARKLGLPHMQVSNWFDRTAKKLACVERMQVGIYRFVAKPLTDPPPVKQQPAFRRVRGGLTELILAELKAAGEAGVPLKTIAERLQLPCHNVRSWYQTTGRRIPGVEHNCYDRHRFNPGTFPNPFPVTQLILGALASAGPNGLRVREITARTGLNGHRVSMWLTRKCQKIPQLERIGVGVYRYNPGS